MDNNNDKNQQDKKLDKVAPAESVSSEKDSNSTEAGAGPELSIKQSTNSPVEEKKTTSQATSSTQTPSPSVAQPKSASAEKKSPAKNSSSSRPLLKLFLILCLLLLVAAGAFWGWTLYQSQQSQPTVVMKNQVDSEDIQRLEQQIHDERIARERELAVLSQTINESQLKINSHASRLRQLSTTSRTDWLLAEAEYLIRLANQRLITERNTKNATSLLVSADVILRDLDQVDLLPVRQALAKSITALRTVSKIDREGLYLQLEAISDQLVQLPLIVPESDETTLIDRETSDTDVPVSEEPVAWRQKLSQGFYSALDSASTLIRIKHRDVPVKPLPSEEEEQYLRYNLAILLEQAQMGLLREEPVIYQASLAKARKWVADSFELNDAATQLVDQLKSLEQENVVQQLPDISEGLEVLRDYIDSWHKRHVIKSPGESTATDNMGMDEQATGVQQ